MTPAAVANRESHAEPPAGTGMHLVDLVCAIYLAVSALAACWFRARYPGWVTIAALHAAAIGALWWLVREAAARPDYRILQMIRLLYPIAVYLLGWSEVKGFTPMIFGGYVATPHLMAADRAIFGAPPYQWIPRFYSPWLDETMVAFYSCYFLLPLLAVWLWWRGRRGVALAVLSIVMFDYSLNYAFFPLVPALDPRMANAAAGHPVREYTGFVLAAITRFLEPHGGIPGGCFPSSHVSGTVAWCLAAWRYVPRIGPAFTVISAGVVVSTVYLLYHHGVDSLAGIALGGFSFLVAQMLLRARHEVPR